MQEPAVILLSGGLDSATTAAIARQQVHLSQGGLTSSELAAWLKNRGVDELAALAGIGNHCFQGFLGNGDPSPGNAVPAVIQGGVDDIGKPAAFLAHDIFRRDFHIFKLNFRNM